MRLVKKRCMGEDGFPRCENKKCLSKGKPVPAIQADHIRPIGEIGGPDYIKRMFVSSKEMQGLCKKCHAEKTKQEKNSVAGVLKRASTKKLKFTDTF